LIVPAFLRSNLICAMTCFGTLKAFPILPAHANRGHYGSRHQ
jgi:hypothetical protein